MARIKQGILGPITGRIANIIGYERLGQPVIRSIGRKSSIPRSDAQKAVSMKFKLTKAFLKPLKNFINVSYKTAVKGSTKIPENQAQSYNSKFAIKGIYPDLEIDYTKVMVSEGDLPGAENITIELEGNMLKFKWDSDPELHHHRFRDQAMLVAYLPTNNNAFYTVSSARRSAGEDILEIHPVKKANGNDEIDQSVEAYIAFISDDREQVSNSIYAGRIAL